VKAATQLKTIVVAVGITTVCALCLCLWGAIKGRPPSKFSSRVLRIERDSNGAVSAWCSLDNPGRRGLIVACDYYETKTPEGWRPRDEYNLGPWYVPPRSSRTVVLPATSVTNHWRVVWLSFIPRTNYNRVELWAEDWCVSKLRRYSPLTPPRFAVTSEIKSATHN
jgi:hypothetical protein